MEESSFNHVRMYAGEGRSTAWSPMFSNFPVFLEGWLYMKWIFDDLGNANNIFFSLTATAQDVQLTKLEWW